jgi:hypothetical protein
MLPFEYDAQFLALLIVGIHHYDPFLHPSPRNYLF